MAVYFIQCEQTLTIKIGHSAKIQKRMAVLQTGHAGKLRLLGTTDLHPEDDLHQKFAEHRLQGEWFEPAPNLIAFLKDLGLDPLTAAPLHPGNPLWRANKLHAGDWYDRRSGIQFEKEIRKHVDLSYCDACIDNRGEHCAEDDPGCPNLAVIDLFGLFQMTNIDGALFDQANRSAGVVFRRDQFSDEVEYIRYEIRRLSAALNICAGWRLVGISWDEAADFRLEDYRNDT